MSRTSQEKIMDAEGKIVGSVENWENGQLGRELAHAKRAPKELEREIDEAQGLQAISIRLNKELIEEFKFIAKQHDMGYQPLMRKALTLFAQSEFKRIAIKLENEKAAAEEAAAAKEAATTKDCLERESSSLAHAA